MKKFKNASMVAIAAILMMALSSYNNPCPAVDPIDHTVLLSAENCSDFYSCSNGIPILMHCPEGLYFNPELDVCDWVCVGNKKALAQYISGPNTGSYCCATTTNDYNNCSGLPDCVGIQQ